MIKSHGRIPGLTLNPDPGLLFPTTTGKLACFKVLDGATLKKKKKKKVQKIATYYTFPNAIFDHILVHQTPHVPVLLRE